MGYEPIIYWRKIKYLLEDVKLKFDEVIVYIDISDAYDETQWYDLSDDMKVISRVHLTAFGAPVPISLPFSRFNIFETQETANKDLISVKGENFSKTPSSETKVNFYHWNPSNKRRRNETLPKFIRST